MPHLLHEMKSSRVPRRFVFFDTEAHRTQAKGLERQTWRLGVTLEVHWQSKERQWSRPILTRHATPETLWQVIVRSAREDSRTVVVAHNLSYDLRIADGFTWLPRLGWSIEKLVLAPEHVGFDAAEGRNRLVFIDSTTTLPQSIDSLGKLLEIDKPKLPTEGDSDETWFGRCAIDTEIIAHAYLTIVDALRSQDLGCWARTGAGIGWNTVIRRHLNAKVLVHEDDALRTIEQEAIYGGRAEAWQWGRLRREKWHEWDYELAYAAVAGTETLPAYYQDHVASLSLRHIRRTYPATRWLCHAHVSQSQPLLPARDEHGTYFPTGTLTGWWWDCELIMAEDYGAEVTVIEAHRYKGEPWLQTWASWVQDLVADTSSPQAKVLGVAAKHWQRSVIGRSAMRYGNWTEVGPAYINGVSYMDTLDLESGVLGATFQAGGRRWESFERTWWDQALPQLLSAVSAHCRVRLWNAMQVAGPQHVAYVDTDSLIVDSQGSERLRLVTGNEGLGSLREKSTIARLDVWAPRYVTSPHFTRIAGVGSDRERTGPHKYRSSVWERLPEALAGGHPDEVQIRKVVAEMALEDWHRIHLPSGNTRPYSVVDGVREESVIAVRSA